MADRRLVAFYYPGWIWRDSAWVKNLLLFFDGIALLVPDYMRDRPEIADPAIVEGLREHDLLTIVEPDELIDAGVVRHLVAQFGDVLGSGVMQTIRRDEPMAELSMSRLGYRADRALAEMMVDELKAHGLAADSLDGVSIRMHPVVRNLVLVLLAQILRRKGESLGLDLSPATDTPEIHAMLAPLLGLSSAPSAGHVVSLDVGTVGVDLSAVGIEEILEFREAHGSEYRAYARDLREAVRTLGLLAPDERAEALRDRQETLEDEGRALAECGRRWWKTPASMMLSVGGAAWTAKTGDPVGALVAAGSAAIAAVPSGAAIVDSHSYLYRAKTLGS